VIIALPDGPDYVGALFGILKIGAVVVMVNPELKPEAIAYFLEYSRAVAVLTTAEHAAPFRAAAERMARPATLLLVRGAELTAALEQAPASWRNYPTHPDDPAIWLFSGGTTGRPKGVLATHRARAVTAHTVMVEEAIDERDIVGIVTPMFHVAALNIMFQPAVLVGATAVFVTPWSPAAFVDAVEAERITATFMVPTQANALAMLPGLEGRDLKSWTKLSFAGAPMPDWVQVELMRRLPQLRLTQIYGQSEMGVIAALPWQRARDKLGTVGRQPYNVDVAVLRPDGTPADAGELGEVASRGDNLMIGYYGEPQQTAEFFRLGNGWGLSGDVGVMDAEGYITLLDRAKDMLISGGENVYPKEIEQVLYELPEVAECAVFGIPDEKWGEVPAAYLQLKPGSSLDEARVVAQCEQKLARHKRPRLVRFVEDFPKTPIGKIQKNLLKEPYWAGRKKI